MTTYAREHPLQSIIAIVAVLTMLALGLYVASANAGSGGQTNADDRGGMVLLKDDPAGDDRGGATKANDDLVSHDAGDDHGGLTTTSDDPSGDDHGGDR